MIGGYSSVADIGSQTQADGSGAEQFYEQRGVERYEAFDIDGKHGARLHDFNEDTLPEDSFDLVVNNGTAEHIFHVPNVFEAAHNLSNREGAMVHILPWVGWLNHGFFNFQPIFFRDLAAANGYAIEALYAADREGHMIRLDVPAADPYHHPKPWKEPLTDIEKATAAFGERANIFIAAILRQSPDKKPFVAPIQGKYQDAFADFSQPIEAQRPLLNVQNSELVLDPFPHILCRPALPEDYYAELLENWPSWKDVSGDQKDDEEYGNVLHQRSAKDVIAVPDIPPVWRKFFMDHTSGDWFAQLMEAFDHEELLKPFFSLLQKEELNLGIRGTGPADVLLDCQFAINTPTRKRSFVRGPHIDNPVQLLAGLLYMPDPRDKAGGSLKLYDWKQGTQPVLYGKAEADPQDVTVLYEVPYEENTAIFFLNGPNSLHGVSTREPGPFPRRYINFLVEGNQPWFQMPPKSKDQELQTLFCRDVHRRAA